MTKLEQDIKRHTDALNSPANAWGQHLIDGAQSHFFLMRMYRQHGEAVVQVALDAHYSAKDREKMLSKKDHTT